MCLNYTAFHHNPRVRGSSPFGRYGYRRIAALLREAGWSVSDGRIERLWRREGLKVPQKQSKKGRLWLNDGSCVRLRPKYRNHVWSYDFVHCRTDDGKVFRTLNILDEFSRECLAIKVDRKLNSTNLHWRCYPVHTKPQGNAVTIKCFRYSSLG